MHLIEVFLIAMNDIYIMYMVCLVASRLVILLYAIDFSSHHKPTILFRCAHSVYTDYILATRRRY